MRERDIRNIKLDIYQILNYLNELYSTAASPGIILAAVNIAVEATPYYSYSPRPRSLDSNLLRRLIALEQ